MFLKPDYNLKNVYEIDFKKLKERYKSRIENFKEILNTDKYFEVMDKFGNTVIYDKSEYNYEIYGDYYGRK